jgi:hypothetical protein
LNVFVNIDKKVIPNSIVKCQKCGSNVIGSSIISGLYNRSIEDCDFVRRFKLPILIAIPILVLVICVLLIWFYYLAFFSVWIKVALTFVSFIISVIFFVVLSSILDHLNLKKDKRRKAARTEWISKAYETGLDFAHEEWFRLFQIIGRLVNKVATKTDISEINTQLDFATELMSLRHDPYFSKMVEFDQKKDRTFLPAIAELEVGIMMLAGSIEMSSTTMDFEKVTTSPLIEQQKAGMLNVGELDCQHPLFFDLLFSFSKFLAHFASPTWVEWLLEKATGPITYENFHFKIPLRDAIRLIGDVGVTALAFSFDPIKPDLARIRFVKKLFELAKTEKDAMNEFFPTLPSACCFLDALLSFAKEAPNGKKILHDYSNEICNFATVENESIMARGKALLTYIQSDSVD